MISYRRNSDDELAELERNWKQSLEFSDLAKLNQLRFEYGLPALYVLEDLPDTIITIELSTQDLLEKIDLKHPDISDINSYWDPSDRDVLQVSALDITEEEYGVFHDVEGRIIPKDAWNQIKGAMLSAEESGTLDAICLDYNNTLEAYLENINSGEYQYAISDDWEEFKNLYQFEEVEDDEDDDEDEDVGVGALGWPRPDEDASFSGTAIGIIRADVGWETTKVKTHLDIIHIIYQCKTEDWYSANMSDIWDTGVPGPSRYPQSYNTFIKEGIEEILVDFFRVFDLTKPTPSDNISGFNEYWFLELISEIENDYDLKLYDRDK